MNLLTSIFLLISTIVIIGGSFGIIYYIQNIDKFSSNVDELTEQVCTDAGGSWSSCGSKCQILSVGNSEIVCTTVCEEICTCGGLIGIECPSGYNCVLPENIPDAQGFCEKE